MKVKKILFSIFAGLGLATISALALAWITYALTADNEIAICLVLAITGLSLLWGNIIYLIHKSL